MKITCEKHGEVEAIRLNSPSSIDIICPRCLDEGMKGKMGRRVTIEGADCMTDEQETGDVDWKVSPEMPTKLERAEAERNHYKAALAFVRKTGCDFIEACYDTGDRPIGEWCAACRAAMALNRDIGRKDLREQFEMACRNAALEMLDE